MAQGRIASFKARLGARKEKLAGTFLKTPSVDLIEILAGSGLDFIVLDAEHAPFDRARLDTCLAIGRALDFPLLVRVPEGSPAEILKVLDSGAVGIVVPHVDSAEKAAAVARAARFGPGGRGYAGSTRWAGFATRPMPDIMAQSAAETVVMVQIEEVAGVDSIDAIATTAGVDAVFIGPADLSVAYGHQGTENDDLQAAMARVGQAAKSAGIAYVTWVPNAAVAQAWSGHGFNCYVMGSEHSWILQGARAAVQALKSDP